MGESQQTIEGTVSRDGAPVGGAYVRLIGPSGEFTAEEYTKDDGKFRFFVVDGTWRLEVRAPGATTATHEVAVAGDQASVSVELQPA